MPTRNPLDDTGEGRSRRHATGLLLALVALSAAAYVIRMVSPTPYVRGVSEKSDYLSRHLGEINVLFIGTSVIYRHISPAEFDAVTAEGGLATRSFNLGLPYMSAWEALHLLERIQQTQPRHLDWVVMDASVPERPTHVANVKTRRFVYWHDLRSTWLRSRALAFEGLRAGQTLDISRHWVAFFFNVGNVGRLSPLVFGDQPLDSSILGPDGDGWSPLLSSNSRILLRRRAFEADTSKYDEAVARLARSQGFDQRLRPGVKDVVRRLCETVRSMRAQPVFVTPPIVEPRFELRQLHSVGEIEHHFAFNDPNRFPNFYRHSDRFDRGHLTEEASLRFTRLLAERLVEIAGARAQ